MTLAFQWGGRGGGQKTEKLFTMISIDRFSEKNEGIIHSKGNGRSGVEVGGDESLHVEPSKLICKHFKGEL